MRDTHNLQTSAEALREVLAFRKRFPGVGQHQRGEHRGQANAVLTRAGIPSEHLSLAQPAATLRAVPAGVEIHAFVARHLGTSFYVTNTTIQSRTIRFVPKAPGRCPWVDGGIYGC